MPQTTFSVRMDSEVKKQLDDFCAQVGMNSTTAFNMFARAVLREKRLPFEITTAPKPNYITLLPPGKIIAEKIFEMGIDAAELARRCRVSLDTIQKLLNAEIPLTQKIAKEIERVTWMQADGMMRIEEAYQRNLAFHKDHPEYPVL